MGYIEKYDDYDIYDVEGIQEVLDPGDYGIAADIIMEWLAEKNVKDIGREDYDTSYDEDMNYIGKGPNGYYEVLMMISEVARELQKNNFITDRFGKIPIIIHDLEYSWYCEQAIVAANPNNEADEFLEQWRRDAM